ncbi:MAG: signal peptidase I [Candidatus Woesearchaeota archaeon]
MKKDVFKKIWHFLWKEDSLASWIVNIVLAFLLIKFIVYPGLGLILGTNLPVVAVISESMEHNGNFDTWWNSQALCSDNPLNMTRCTQKEWYSMRGITEEEFKKFPFSNGFNKGDIMVLKGIDYENIKKGDVIVFKSGMNYPIIHRVVEKNDVIQTKGDHNVAQIISKNLDERYITKDEIIGKAWFRIPLLGYIKIWFVDLLRCITFNGCYFS